MKLLTMFFVNSIKNPSPRFNILNYVADFLLVLQDLLALNFTIGQPPPSVCNEFLFLPFTKIMEQITYN